MYNILVCDDEKEIVMALKVYLSSEGYHVLEACNGREALKILDENDIKLLLMDIMMPEMDGIAAMSEIRKKYNLPVILLTAKSEYTDKILGLNVGADDYITKPFNPVEVIARVKSQIRRYVDLGSDSKKNNGLRVGGLELDDKTKVVLADGERVNLTPTEYEILKLFMENPGEVFSPKTIYRRVWNDDPIGAENTVLVHIRHLREKIEINPAEPRYIVAVWGHGYKLIEN